MNIQQVMSIHLADRKVTDIRTSIEIHIPSPNLHNILYEILQVDWNGCPHLAFIKMQYATCYTDGKPRWALVKFDLKNFIFCSILQPKLNNMYDV